MVASASSNLLRSTDCFLLKSACARSSLAIWRWRILSRYVQAAAAFRARLGARSPLSSNSGSDFDPNESFEFSNPTQQQKMTLAAKFLQIQAARNRLSGSGESSGSGPVASQFRTTTSLQYTQSLNNLMVTLRKSRPYFIRCIRSNSRQKKMLFEDYLVREQLISSGMEETVRLKQSSYPIRMSHRDFRNTYKALCPQNLGTRRKTLVDLLLEFGLEPGKYSLWFRTNQQLNF